jgi:hypothetical protein
MNRIIPILIVISFSGYALGKDLGCGVSTIPANLIEYGCGCGYYSETQPNLLPALQSDFGFESPQMFIDGKLVQVTAYVMEDIPGNPKLGDKFRQTYKFEHTEMTFTNTVSFVCPEGSESCEVTSFDAELSIMNMHCKSPIQKVTGDCGC